MVYAYIVSVFPFPYTMALSDMLLFSYDALGFPKVASVVVVCISAWIFYTMFQG